MNIPHLLTALFIGILACGCGANNTRSANRTDQATNAAVTDIPKFSADTAMARLKSQVAFGPRVPGTDAHKETAKWLIDRIAENNPDTIIVQSPEITFPDGKKAEIHNILGQWGLDRQERVLLLAHWDTRPVADEDPEAANRTHPIDGANDGGSGTAVLLEIARILSQSLPPAVGVDILLVDAEDSGIPDDEMSWCLGTQYWTDHLPYKPTSMPRFAILLDMVGGRNAKFHREYLSDQFAGPIVNKVWSAAATAGYSSRFPNMTGNALTDDHVFLNRAGIPAIDIVENRNQATGSFNPTWHTLDDNIANIDPTTLGIVGEVILHVIYNEK